MTVNRVCKLEGAILDAAVARAEGWPADRSRLPINEAFRPSSVWAHGGPIIEREQIDLETGINSEERPPDNDFFWRAYCAGLMSYGTTPLMAAMRAYVASKFGDEFDLP